MEEYCVFLHVCSDINLIFLYKEKRENTELNKAVKKKKIIFTWEKSAEKDVKIHI